MQLNRRIPVLALLGGLIGAGLRAVQLLTAFERSTGLYISENPCGKLLLGWLLLFAAILAVAARAGQHDASFEELYAGSGDFYKTILAFSGLLLAAGGIGWLAVEMHALMPLTKDTEPWIIALELPFGALCVAAGLCMVGLGAVLSRGELEKKHAYMVLPPLFWAAFHLLVAYRQYCVSANLALFTPEIFAAIACVLACYYFARMLYGKPAPRLFVFWAANAIMLTLTDTLGYAFNRMMGGTAVQWTTGSVIRACCLICGCVFLLVELGLMTSRVFPARPRGNPVPESE